MRALLCFAAAIAVLAENPDPWKPLEFLAGQWAGEGKGPPGEGAGGSSFDFDLQHKVLIRKNYAVYPTFRHDDLMVVYLDPVSKALKAIYFDNEEHVIHYTVESGEDWVRFLSEAYRLTYRKAGRDKLLLDFDIAPPGKPFANYIHAELRRK